MKETRKALDTLGARLLRTESLFAIAVFVASVIGELENEQAAGGFISVALFAAARSWAKGRGANN